jgi:glyoxylase-like metal-dependent hydrolase (beta-lactamase superfamily II)
MNDFNSHIARSILATTVLVAASLASAQFATAQQNFDNVDVNVLHVRDDIYMLVGAGGNITAQVGDDGVLIVDTQFAPLTGKIVAALRTITAHPIHYIINTHHHGDHIGGNATLRVAGSTVIGGNMPGAVPYAEGGGAQVVAHENVLLRLAAMTGEQAIPAAGWPTNTFFDAEKRMHYNGEGIRMIHQPAAHSDGDLFVYFRRSDVIATGDVFSTSGWPILDLGAGGSYQGTIEALNELIDLMIPVYGQDGGTLAVPGHGRLSGIGDVLDYREMVIVIGDRQKSMIANGMSLEQVKAAEPALDYEPVYGTSTSFWTTEQYLEAAYTRLSE